jgi:hypothetical protein
MSVALKQPSDVTQANWRDIWCVAKRVRNERFASHISDLRYLSSWHKRNALAYCQSVFRTTSSFNLLIGPVSVVWRLKG